MVKLPTGVLPHVQYNISMAKVSSIFVCQQCGFRSSSYLGKCPECGNWNTFVEQVEAPTGKLVSGSKKVAPGKIEYLTEVEKQHYQRISTDIGEFDRVLGGGIVKGSVVLVSGDPGIGKSTLLTQLALNISTPKPTKANQAEVIGNVLYVAGEESAQQIKIRADRIQPKANIPVLNEVDVDIISATVQSFKPSLVIVDSIQTLQTTDLSSAAGSIGQVRECAQRLQKLAKTLHIPIFLVGHVTKEGVVAGPRTLEHLVDVVLALEGDPTSQFRILRANKNRFGPTDEVGIFDMAETGMKEIENPSMLFLETRAANLRASGSAVVPVLTGLRPILVEIQALVTKTNFPMPRRTGSGIDNNRLQLLVAVLQKRLKLPLWDQDIFVNVTGGLKVMEPAADLGICLAIVSSYKDQPIPKDMAFIGEVGLLGELRIVGRIDKRTGEAKKLGYKNVISSENAKTLTEAVTQALK